MEIKLSPSLFPAAQLQQTSFAYDTDSERFKTDKPSLSRSLQDEPSLPYFSFSLRFFELDFSASKVFETRKDLVARFLSTKRDRWKLSGGSEA